MEKVWTSQEKKQLKIFALIAFGLPVIMGIVMGITYYRGFDVTSFPAAQMFYPAAGVMLAALIVKRKEIKLPMKFFVTYLVTTAIIMLLAIGSAFVSSPWWYLIINYVMIVGSVLSLIMLLLEKKAVRDTFNLRFGARGPGKALLYVGLFLVLYILRIVIGYVIEGQPGELLTMLNDPATLTLFITVLLTFFLSFLAFFGEEYGWRYFFQPLLQKRFGLRGGVILLGVLWGLWHLPINVFYYSPQTWLQSICNHQITCITYAVFFGFVYMKTKNIWAPVMIHYLNNNLILVLTQSADIGNQVIRWSDLLIVLAINTVLFMPFLLSKEFKKGGKPEILPFEAEGAEEKTAALPEGQAAEDK